jgi:hypothetical protein
MHPALRLREYLATIFNFLEDNAPALRSAALVNRV